MKRSKMQARFGKHMPRFKTSDFRALEKSPIPDDELALEVLLGWAEGTAGNLEDKDTATDAHCFLMVAELLADGIVKKCAREFKTKKEAKESLARAKRFSAPEDMFEVVETRSTEFPYQVVHRSAKPSVEGGSQ